MPLFADDEEAQEALEESIAALGQAWDDGVLFPKLVTPGTTVEPTTCRTCEVAQACLRGDSAARRRLSEVADLPSELPPAFNRVWLLNGKAPAKETAG